MTGPGALLRRADRWVLGIWAQSKAEVQRRARLALGFTLFVAVTLLFFVGIGRLYMRDSALLSLVCGGGAALFGMMFVWARRGGSLTVVSVVLLTAAHLLIAGAAIASFGVAALATPWLAVLVLMATYLLGSRGGWITAGTLALLILGLWLSERAGLVHPVEPAFPALAGRIVLPVLLSLGVTAGISSFYRHTLDEEAAEKLKVELELKRAQRLESLGQLVAGIAHEINNPLSFILTNVDWVKDQLGADGGPPLAECRDALADAAEGADRVRRIVADLKAFSRETDDDSQWLELRELVGFTLKLCGNLVKHVATVKLDVPPGLQVHAPRVRLGQVLVNLVTNAAQAIAPGHQAAHQISVRARPKGDGCLIEVTDTGVGIAPELQERIFEPFFTTKDVGAGTGLGLSVSLGLIQKLAGTLTVESTPGRGTTVRIELPKAREHAPPQPLVAPPVHELPLGVKVLVIDDEPKVVRSVARALRGAHVTGETDAARALELCRAGHYDVVLCDLMMPRMGGDEFFAALSTFWPDAHERVVFITGGALSHEAECFLEHHSSVTKPLDELKLFEAIAQRLARAPRAA